MVKEVIILIGPPGIGKSTLVNDILLKKNPEYVVASTDNIFVRWGAEKGMSYDEAFRHFSFKDVESAFKNDIRRAVNEGKSVIIDRTNMSLKGRSKVMNYFPDEYRRIGYVFEFSDLDALNRQLEKRRLEEGKSISPKVMEEMLEKYVEPSNDEFDEIIKIKQ